MKKRISSMLLAALLLLTCASVVSAEDTVNLLLTAKTTQAFSQEAVSAEDLDVILSAGAQATSAINQQPWHFVAISNPDVLSELGSGSGFAAPAGGAAPAGAPEGMEASSGAPAGAPDGMGASSGAPAGGAPAATGTAKAGVGDSPVAIVIYRNDGTPSPDPDFDCGLACQNMVIAANALGYGTKIVSSPTRTLNGDAHDTWCQRLNVDAAYQAVAVLLIGRVDAEIDAASGASTRNGLEAVVSYIE